MYILKKMALTEDHKELITSWGTTILDSYKILVACLLSVFVPQYCPENGTCTLSENFSNLTIFNAFVLAFNFLTLALFVHLYYLQTKRETYFITHLDSSSDQAFNSLETNLKEYPRIFGRVKDHNANFFLSVKITTIAFYLNVLFSSILVCYFYYNGMRTVTTLLANVLLASGKLYATWGLLNSKKHVLALSALRSYPVSYNVIDDDYKTSKGIELTPTL